MIAMEKEQTAPVKSGPIIVEASGLRIWIDRRRGAVGDEGITFDVTVAGEEEGTRILRFDCFSSRPHYHVGPTTVHRMSDEGIERSVRWTLEQLKTRLPALVAEAGYETLALTVDQTAIAGSLGRVEKDIHAKIDAGAEPKRRS
jgi:hypothetical protein